MEYKLTMLPFHNRRWPCFFLSLAMTRWVVFLLILAVGCRRIGPLDFQVRGDQAVTPDQGKQAGGDLRGRDRIASEPADNNAMGCELSVDPFICITPIAGPRNVVLFIGDGMGLAHMKAASYYEYGAPDEIYFQAFDVRGMVTTAAANAEITDSAAAATAMACGRKVNQHVVGLAIPGDGSPLPNLTEYFKSVRKSTGLVTTATMTHATPAGFAAHTDHRGNTPEIAKDYLLETRPNVLFGGGGDGMTIEAAENADYTVIDTLVDFDDSGLKDEVYLSGQFGNGYLPYEFFGLPEGLPHIWEMSEVAIRVLSRDPEGFFVMIEGARIDHAGHDNNFPVMVGELTAFERAVKESVTNGALSDDTLYIVTADHGTGGLVVEGGNGMGVLPDAHFTTTGHTDEDVPIYVSGMGAEQFELVISAKGGLIDNTDIYRVLTELFLW